MVDLSSIPLVMPLANWIWGADVSAEVSPEICLSQIPFLNSGCFSQLTAKALGLLIILGSCINKVPLIMNMVKSKSATGISRNSLYGESIVYACGAYYGMLFNYPFSSYGENVSLMVQSFILVVMSWNLSSIPVSISEKVMAFGIFAIFTVVSLFFLPDNFRYLLMSSTWPMMIFSRGSQILETYKVKQTGNLSVITTTMNLVGGLIRVGTTIKETGDMVILAGYLLSLILNLTMFVQYFLYLKNTTEAATKAKKE